MLFNQWLLREKYTRDHTKGYASEQAILYNIVVPYSNVALVYENIQ